MSLSLGINLGLSGAGHLAPERLQTSVPGVISPLRQVPSGGVGAWEHLAEGRVGGKQEGSMLQPPPPGAHVHTELKTQQ